MGLRRPDIFFRRIRAGHLKSYARRWLGQQPTATSDIQQAQSPKGA